MKNSKILKLIYNKNNFIKLLIVCILSYIIYLLYYKINKINEGFVTYPTAKSALYKYSLTGEIWTVPNGVTQATFTVIGGKGGNGTINSNVNKPIRGGLGGVVTTTIPVVQGNSYYIYVGDNAKGFIGGKSGDPSINNINGNFCGGTTVETCGGGGAASYIASADNTPIIIAGGGGGGSSARGGDGNFMKGNGEPFIIGNLIIYGGIGGEGVLCKSVNCSKGSDGNISNKTGAGGGGSTGGGSGYELYSTGGAGGSYIDPNINSSNSKFESDLNLIGPSILIDWSNSPTITKQEKQEISPSTYLEGISDTWIVPPGIIRATFIVVGGKGGSTADTAGFGTANTDGGFGANVKTTIAVTPGTTYNIYVGNNGVNRYGGRSSDPKNIFGGGNGGQYYTTVYSGGGGAASYVALSNNTPIIIAGGGGGGSTGGSLGYQYFDGGNGGNGGINSNGDGGNGFGNSIASGGNNSTKGSTASENGGGGGGGCNAGLSGDDYAGGCAGSSCVNISNINTSYSTDTTGSPFIKISWTSQPTTTTYVPTTTQYIPNITSSQPTSTQPTTTQPTSTSSQPTSTQPTITSTQPTITSSQPTITSSQPTITSSQPTITSSQPTSTQPTITSIQPTTTQPLSGINISDNEDYLNGIMSKNRIFWSDI